MRQYTKNFARATAPIKLRKPKPIPKQEPQAQPIPQAQPVAKPIEKKPPVQPKENMMTRWKDSLKSMSDDFATLMRGRKG